MKVEVSVPSEHQGAIISQISKRNGVITGTDERDGYFTVESEVSGFYQSV